MDWIATRTLVDIDTGAEVHVRMAAPTLGEHAVWTCRVSAVEGETVLLERVAHGSDGMQALAMGLEHIRHALPKLNRRLTWLGSEPGLHGFHRVPFGFGLELVNKLEGMIDAEVEKYAEECLAGLHRPPGAAVKQDLP